jgi:hypothetical protein
LTRELAAQLRNLPQSFGVWGGALIVLLVAVALFSRFSIDDTLSRDEAIYAYGGQQLTDGLPFYVSIFDAKTPLAPMIAGAAVGAARAVGADDLYAIRVAFFLFACLTVVAVYLLIVALFGSVSAGLVGAATFSSFGGFALDALTGPDAKTPGIFFAVLSMLLLVRRRYFWGALTGALAFLVWQPLAIYAAVAIAAAALAAERGQRGTSAGKALGGAAIPVAATAAYFLLERALDDLVDGVFVFPVTHLQRSNLSLLERIDRIIGTVNRHYGETRVLFWGGLVLLLVLGGLRIAQRREATWSAVKNDPYIHVVVASFLPIVAVTATDFQGYPDLYPALPYAAIGIGAGFALAASRLDAAVVPQLGRALAAVAVIGLAILSWFAYSDDRPRDTGLLRQRSAAARIEQVLASGGTLYALGNPAMLVLTERRNPDRYVYLEAGVDGWVVDHVRGGFDGWTAAIRAADPSVVILDGWRSRLARRMRASLRVEYVPMRASRLRVFVAPAFAAQAERAGFVPRRASGGG